MDPREVLGAAGALAASIPFTALIVGHALTVCSMYRRAHQDRFLLNLTVSLLAGLGGGTLTAILLQAPARAGIVLFTKQECFWWIVAWWAMNYCPGDLVARLHALLPVRAAARVCLNVLRAGLIVQRVDAAVATFPGVALSPIAFGTLAGCGGKIITDALAVASGEARGPCELSQPGFPLWSALLAALSDYLLVHVTRTLTAAEGLALVTTVFVAHGLACDLTGRRLDYTRPVAQLVHKLTFIPMPGGEAAGKAAAHKANGKSTPRNPATPTPSVTKQLAHPGELNEDDAHNAPANTAVAAAAAAAAPPQPPAATPGRVTRRRRAAAVVAAGTSNT